MRLADRLKAGGAQTNPSTSLNQLRVSAGALGDSYGSGAAVGSVFDGKSGVRISV